MTCGQALRLIRLIDLLHELERELTKIEAETTAQHIEKASEAIAVRLTRAAGDILEVRNELSISGREVS